MVPKVFSCSTSHRADLIKTFTRLGMAERGHYALGVLTAVASSPMLRPPTEWLPEILGDWAPGDAAEAEQVTADLMTAYNGTLHALEEADGELGPADDEENAVAEWCRGYVDSARRDPDWVDDEEAHADLFPLAALAGMIDLNQLEHSEAENIRQQLPGWKERIVPLARQFHSAWAEARELLAEWQAAELGELGRRPGPPGNEVPLPIRREGPKIGRNSPCPCGSGKKYKRCCG